MATENSQSRSSGNRGFAAMDAARQREIASRGGRAAHAQGTAHEFSSEEARAAGRKGGQAAHERGNAHEFTSEEARAAGRKGGQASQGSRNRIQQQQAENNNSRQAVQQENPERESGRQRGDGYRDPASLQHGYMEDDMEKDQD